MTSQGERTELLDNLAGRSEGWRMRLRIRVIAVWLALALAVFNSLAVAAGFALISARSAENCSRLHVLTRAGLMILDSPGNLREALKEGTLTQAEYDEAIAQIHRFDPLRKHNLEIWRSADCPTPKVRLR